MYSVAATRQVMSVCTLCIPRTKDSFTYDDVEMMFEKLKWGIVHNVSIHKKMGYACVFIKLGWFKSQRVKQFKSLIEEDCVNVVYNFDIYKIVLSRPRKRA